MDPTTMTVPEENDSPPPPPAPLVVNPYKKLSKEQEMGGQSQRRNNQTKRAKLLAQQRSNKKRKQQEAKQLRQLTLEKKKAFEPDRDCTICSSKRLGTKPPKRPHHVFCPKNTKTRGIPDHLVEAMKEEERLKKEANKEVTYHPIIMRQEDFNLFFRLNNKPVSEASNEATTVTEDDWKLSRVRKGKRNCIARTDCLINNQVTSAVGSDEYVFMQSVLAKYKEIEQDESIMCPKTMYALAKTIAETCLERKRDVRSLKPFMRDMCLTVPDVRNNKNALWESIVGRRLYIVDWELFMPVEFQKIGLKCPKCNNCTLQRERTNLSRSKSLFPIFGLDGAPSYALVMHYHCKECNTTHAGNDGALLNLLPPHFAKWYPVEAKWARGAQHFDITTTTVLEEEMLTYGNGDHCSGLLYAAINRDYRNRTTNYYSFCDATHQQGQEYPAKDGEWLTRYPPLGETIRQAYHEASRSRLNPWRTSDYERHTREIQAVGCQTSFAQDHTFQAVKNYPKRLKAEAVWDAANEVGEIACAILVPNLETKTFSHAAQQLCSRGNFNPSVIYSDTFPHKSDYWVGLLGEDVVPRLGLFHFLQRIIKTLRHKHMDFGDALRELLDCIYEYHDGDFHKVITALKNGTLGGKKYNDKQIAEMRQTKVFRERYGKYLRKIIRAFQTIVMRLEEWKIKYKVRSRSDSGPPARGRLNHKTQQPLFTQDTHSAIENCKKKAEFLADPIPIEDMYREIKPHPKSSHQLSEWVSYRGESKLESWHNNLAHFSNGGTNEKLSDGLNLCGTARYNRQIQHKLRFVSKTTEQRNKKMPAAWETVVSHWNHQQLAFINKLAVRCGASKLFDDVEHLPQDNGERFFSEYLQVYEQLNEVWNISVQQHDFCPCEKCEAQRNMQDEETMQTSETLEQQDTEQSRENEKEQQVEEKEEHQDEANQEDDDDPMLSDEEEELPPPPAPTVQQSSPTRPQRPPPQTQQQPAPKSPPRTAIQPAPRPITMPQPQMPSLPPLLPPNTPLASVHHFQQQLLQQVAYYSSYLGCQPVHQQPTHPQPTQNCCIRNIQYWRRPNRRGIPPHDKSCSNHPSNASYP